MLAPEPRVTARTIRRLSLAGAVGCAAVLLVLAAVVHHGHGPLRLDVSGRQLVAFGWHRIPLRLVQRFVVLGTTPYVVVAIGVLAVAAWLLGDRLALLIAVVGPVTGLALTELILKPVVDRREGSGFGFPSGHTTAIASLAMAGAFIAYRRWGRRGLLGAAPVVVVLPLAMMATVVRLHAHYMSDAVGGVAVGFGTVLAVVALSSGPIATGAMFGRRRGRVPLS